MLVSRDHIDHNHIGHKTYDQFITLNYFALHDYIIVSYISVSCSLYLSALVKIRPDLFVSLFHFCICQTVGLVVKHMF